MLFGCVLENRTLSLYVKWIPNTTLSQPMSTAVPKGAVLPFSSRYNISVASFDKRGVSLAILAQMKAY